MTTSNGSKGGPATILPPEGFASAGDPFDSSLIARLAAEIFSTERGGVGALPGTSASNGNGLTSPYSTGASEIAPPVHPGVTSSVEPASAPSSPAVPSGAEETNFGERPCFHDEPDAFPYDFRSGTSAPAPADLSAAHATPGKSAEPQTAPSEYYFLSGSQVSHPTEAQAPAGFDVETVRRDFPALHQRVNGHPLIWLDNAATTHKPQAVIDAISRYYARDNSNIHRAAHTLAARSTDLYEGAREKVRRFLGAADAKEIVFVRGTTEAINLVAQTFGRQNIGAGDEIVLTTMEHHANIVPWQLLSQQTGAVIRVAPINDRGELLLDQFAALLGPRTKLVSITQVANALGTVNPVEQVIALAHAYGIPVLVDGAQSTPHMPVNVQAMGADFFVFSGHKIFGPTGIGALYGKAALLESMPPWQGGGNMIADVTFAKTVYQGIPNKFEAGTGNIADVVGLGAAIDYLLALGMPAIAAYEHELLAYATEGLATVPGLRPIGTAANKASVLSFVFDGVPTEQVGKYLDQHGIAVRSGHHCAQPALRRFGVEQTVRPSLAFYNTRAEVDTLVRALHAFRRQS